MAINEELSIVIDVDTSQLKKVSEAIKAVKKDITTQISNSEKELSGFGKTVKIGQYLASGITDGIKQGIADARATVQSQGFTGIGQALGNRIKEGLSSALSGIGNVISGVGNTIKRGFSFLTSIPGLLGIAGAGLGLRDIINSASEAQAQTQRFNQAVENTAVSLIATKQGISDLTDEQRDLILSSDEFIAKENEFKGVLNAVGQSARRLGFDDEQAQVALSRLLQTTKDSSLAQKALQTAFDLSRARGIGLEQATLLITRAFTGGGAILRRYGIQLEKGATGLQAIDALQRQVAGSAENATNTFQVQQKILSEAIGNIKEDIGVGLTNALGQVLTPFSTKLNELLSSGVFERIGKQVGDFLINSFNVLAPIVKSVINFFSELVRRINEFVASIPSSAIDSLKASFSNLVITIGNLISKITGTSDSASNLALILVSFISGLILAITKVLEFTNALINLGVQIGNFVVGAITSVTSFFNQVSTFFSGLIDSAYNFGVNLINSFVNGIKSVGGSIRNTIQGFLSGFSVGGIALPSFAEGGKINGAGTGTSDSILARLSNGEFVVNAKSTSQFLPLLHAINSNSKSLGKFKSGFASGGVVNRSIGNISINVTSSGNPQNIANVVSSQLTSQLKSRGFSI